MINAQLEGEKLNVAAVASGRFGLNSSVKFLHWSGRVLRLSCLLINYAAAAVHPAESVRSLRVKSLMPCSRGGTAVFFLNCAELLLLLLLSWQRRLSLSRFPPTLLLLQWKRPGLPSWFHQLNSGLPVRTELQPIETEEGQRGRGRKQGR